MQGLALVDGTGRGGRITRKDIEAVIESGKHQKMLMSVGRRANVDDIGLVNTEIEVADGFIQVNDRYQTKESHIYAIGDVIGGLQLAHVASHEGMLAVKAAFFSLSFYFSLGLYHHFSLLFTS